MRWLYLLFVVALMTSAITVYKNRKNNLDAVRQQLTDRNFSRTDADSSTLYRLKQYRHVINSYTKTNGLNDHYCFLIDMNIPSGKKRFFIYDLLKDTVAEAGLVTHGSGNQGVSDSIIFSNKPGSNCSSPGRYKTGKPYYGKFGLAYKLYGLDKSNSNAFNRFVVLHAHGCVPDMEIAPQKICMSWGCPTVSPLFLSRLRKYIDESDRPILLWVLE